MTYEKNKYYEVLDHITDLNVEVLRPSTQEVLSLEPTERLELLEAIDYYFFNYYDQLKDFTIEDLTRLYTTSNYSLFSTLIEDLIESSIDCIEEILPHHSYTPQNRLQRVARTLQAFFTR